jgi:NAD(P)-dependent dehydrogenase (short-subunit alcohol dehydrogenase family)
VLITGCSTGIGRATAEHLAAAGHTVYATARRTEAIEDLAAKGCRTLALDVTDEASMSAAVKAVEEAEGAVGVLVNNAGYSQSGPVEEIPLDVIRRQFETNVFGLVRMVQLCAPGMRAQGYGKVVNISSMGGKLVFPGGGVYHGTKYAVEALSDALRFELRGFGIDVIVIEPGLITTNFAEAATGAMSDAGLSNDSGPYGNFTAAVAKTTTDAYEGPMRHFGGGPEVVAKTIARAISARRPRARYAVTLSAKMVLRQRALMTDRMWDAMMRSQYPRPGTS